MPEQENGRPRSALATGIADFLGKWFPVARGSLDEKQGPPFKTVDGVRLRVGDFADVGDAQEPGTWGLPLVTSAGGPPDFGRVSAAIQAISPAGFRGNPARLAAPRAQVIGKISGAIGRGAFSDQQKARLRERLNAVKSIVESALVLTKDQKGADWAIGFVSNKYRDRDLVAAPRAGGEILTTEAHREFMSWLNHNPEMAPHLWPWHTPTFAGKELPTKSQAAWWDFMEPEGFVVMAWPLTPTEAAGIRRAEKAFGPLGMSHGFISAEHLRDRNRGLVNRYRTFEGTFLPQNKAANLWTPFQTLQKEAHMPVTDEKRDFLAAVIGEGEVEELEDGAKARADALDALGVESKDTLPPADDDTPEAEAAIEEDPDPEAEPAEDPEPAKEAPDAEAIAKAVAENLGIKELDTFLKGLKSQLEEVAESVQVNATDLQKLAGHVLELQKSDDEKVAELLSPQNDPESPIWKAAASQSDDNVIPDDKELEGPGIQPTEEGAWITKTHPLAGSGRESGSAIFGSD